MPDITMCSNDQCPVRNSCYRHEAKPNKYWQSYSAFVHQDDGGCEYHMFVVDKDEEDYYHSGDEL